MIESELTAVQLAISDELTEISDSWGFQSLVQHCLNFSVRNKFAVSLVFMDLDYFKLINDSFGHEEGDVVLVAFSTLIKNCFRDSDVTACLGVMSLYCF